MKNFIIGATLSLVSLLAVGVGAKEINLTESVNFQNIAQTTSGVSSRTLTNETANATENYCNIQDMQSSVGVETLMSAKSLLSLLSPKLVTFYEANIAHEQIVSNLTSQKRERLMAQLNVSSEKLTATLLLHDLSARAGQPLDIKAVAAMSEGEMFKNAKKCIEKYISTLTPEQRDDLGAKFEALKKQK